MKIKCKYCKQPCFDIKENKKTDNPKTFIVDPGHGIYRDEENGYIYQREEYDNIREDKITIKVAKYLINLLKKENHNIYPTRNINSNEIGESGKKKKYECSYLYLKDKRVVPNKITPWAKRGNYNRDVDIRSKYVNFVNNKIEPVDLVISLHFNAAPKLNTARGCEILYYKSNNKTKKISRNILNNTIKYTGVENRGVKGKINYSILKDTVVNSIIWEGAFFNSEYDRNKFLKDPEYYKKAARGIFEGINKSIKEGLI